MSEMASIEENEITFQEQESNDADGATDLTSFQFVPDKIVDFGISQDGQRSYRVRWKDSWLTEELLTLTYQHLINEFWTTSSAKTETKSKSKNKSSKSSSTKVSNKQDEIEPQFTIDHSQSIQTNGNTAEPTSITIKDLVEVGPTSHLVDHNGLIKTQEILPKGAEESSVNPNALSTIIVDNDVSLADISNLNYQEIAASNQVTTMPKYQQALQASLTVQQTLTQDVTGKVVFPKHVFSQTRYSGKKSQQQKQQNEIPDSMRVTCEICQKSLKTKKMLWAHKVAVHYGGNFPCEICGKKCITGAELRRHMTSHSSERKFACQYCGLAYKRWSHLYQHLRVHEEEKNFRCDVCHVNFKVQSELKDHCFAEHASGKLVQCSVCKHKLQTPLAVYHHSMKHTGTRDFICEICGSNFKRKQHLVTHMKTHYTEKKGIEGANEVYNCQACDESFNLKMELKAHCDVAHPCDGSSEIIHCKTCKKRLNLTHSVYLHGLRHCGVREFKCEACDQFFKRKAHLLRHMADRHPAEPRERKKRALQPDSITCSLCKRSFKYKAALIKHMTMQHGILPKADGEIYIKKGIKKPHQCQHCLKRFKSRNNLAKHITNKHTNSDGTIMAIDYKIEASDHDKANEAGNIEQTDLAQTQEQGISSGSIVKNDGSESELIKDKTSQNIEENMNDNEVEKLLSDSLPVNEEHLSPTSQQSLTPLQHQVVTVDQETGRIILVSTENIMPTQSNEGSAEISHNNEEKIIGKDPLSLSKSTESNASQQQNNVVQSSSVDYVSQALVPALRSITSTSTLNQASGYLVNQDGVALASLPVQTVQELNNTANVLEFSQGSNEQIVVLLSAVNSQNIEQM